MEKKIFNTNVPKVSHGKRLDKFLQSEIKDLIKDLMKDNPYSISSVHDGLGLRQVKEIISYLMYVEDNNSIQVTINKSFDGYHLSLTVNKKDK